jgi:hypothetical protein
VPEATQKRRVERCNVNVGATRLEQCSPPPRPDARDHLLELSPLDDSGFNPGWELRQLILGYVKIAPNMKKPPVGKIRRRRIQEIVRCASEFGYIGAAIAFEIESRRPSGRVVPAMVLGLDNESSLPSRYLGAEARTGDPSADNDDVKFVHLIR